MTTAAERAPTATTTTASAPPTSAAAAIGTAWTEIDLVDETRATDELLSPDGDTLIPPSPSRTIPTVILYPGVEGGGADAPPAEVEPRPLIVWLNGLGGRATPADPLLLALSDAGYVVAAPNTPEIAAPVGAPAGFVHLPQDASAVVDALTAPDDGFADDLAGVIDRARIGVAGHSIGGTGAYGLVFHDCCRDNRISAVAVFAPPAGSPYDGGEYRFEGTPLLIVHGSADQVIPFAQAEQVRDRAEDAFLVVPIGADHYQPVYGNERPNALAASQEVLTAFFDVHVAGVARIEDLRDVFAEQGDRISVR